MINKNECSSKCFIKRNLFELLLVVVFIISLIIYHCSDSYLLIDLLLLLMLPIINIIASSFYVIIINKYIVREHLFNTNILSWCKHFNDPNYLPYCKTPISNDCACQRYNYIHAYSLRQKWIKKSSGLIEKIVLWFVYNIYLRVDFIYNSIQWNYGTSEKEKDIQNCLIDLEILFFLILEIFIYLFVPQNFSYANSISLLIIFLIIFMSYILLGCSQTQRFVSRKIKHEGLTLLLIYCFYVISIIVSIFIINNYNKLELLVCSFFIWRILIILFIRLNEIVSFQFKGAKYTSFNRTFLPLMINLAEIIIGYSFLYSSDHFGVFDKRNFETIFKTMKIFTEWSVKIDNVKVGLEQQFLVLSQIFVFVILVTVFMSVISNFDFQRKNK